MEGVVEYCSEFYRTMMIDLFSMEFLLRKRLADRIEKSPMLNLEVRLASQIGDAVWARFTKATSHIISDRRQHSTINPDAFLNYDGNVWTEDLKQFQNISYNARLKSFVSQEESFPALTSADGEETLSEDQENFIVDSLFHQIRLHVFSHYYENAACIEFETHSKTQEVSKRLIDGVKDTTATLFGKVQFVEVPLFFNVNLIADVGAVNRQRVAHFVVELKSMKQVDLVKNPRYFQSRMSSIELIIKEIFHLRFNVQLGAMPYVVLLALLGSFRLGAFQSIIQAAVSRQIPILMSKYDSVSARKTFDSIVSQYHPQVVDGLLTCCEQARAARGSSSRKQLDIFVDSFAQYFEDTRRQAPGIVPIASKRTKYNRDDGDDGGDFDV